MNYPESKNILEEIKKANKILINCHRSPDPDSVGGALAMFNILAEMGKTVSVICPDDITSDSAFLKSSGNVTKIDYDNFDFSGYDLFLILDSSEWLQVLGYGKNKIPKIRKIVIDHHFTNEGFGDINIVDSERSSTSEVLYRVFMDWDVKISEEIAEDLLTGIVFDTSSLQHPNADLGTAEIYVELLKTGVDKNKIISNLYKNISFENMKVMGEVLKNLQIDKAHRFVWAAVPYGTMSVYPNAMGVKSMAANLYASSVKDTDFGMIMLEEKKDLLNISFRAKKGFDISQIAEACGGGGHKQAGAAMVRDLPFSEAVKKVLEAARSYVENG